MEFGTDMRKKRTNYLMAEKVLPALDAARNRERHFALVRNESVYGPLSSRHCQAILVDLEPLKASDIALSCVGNGSTGRRAILTTVTDQENGRLVQVRKDRAFVARINRVCRITRVCTCKARQVAEFWTDSQ